MEQFKVENGDCDITASVKITAATSLPVGTTDADLNYRFVQEANALKAPVTKDTKVGSVAVWYQNVCVAEAELFATHDVSVQEKVIIENIPLERDSNPFTLLTVVAVIVGLLIILLFGRRVIFRMIRKRQIKRHRRRQRRSR